MKTPQEAARERIRELRQAHAWSQQDLADVLNDRGLPVDRATVARVELGERGLSLDETFLYALALGVAPVHLIVPTGTKDGDSDEPLRIGTHEDISPAELRAWIRGERHFFVQDPRTYYMNVPVSELPERLRPEAES
jgi:transcriptional regulator with XRE-family HTH domain